ncbi:MAG: DUF1109 domain-containing protein [Candidatus Dadabacteria bacterium]|nr:MAG: DUF1109 domain-containing protein [Candidatus Dadabacteria bacterium]
MTETSEFIERIVKDGEAVKPVAPPLTRFLFWILSALVLIICGILIIGPRTDLSLIINSKRFILETFLLAVLVVLSGATALSLSIPDESYGRLRIVLPTITLAGWLTIITYHLGCNCYVAGYSALNPGPGLRCTAGILMIGIIPGIILFFLIKRAAPVNLRLVGFFSFLSLLAVGALALQFICDNPNPAHVLVWHVLPVVTIAILGSLAGAKLFKW